MNNIRNFLASGRTNFAVPIVAEFRQRVLADSGIFEGGDILVNWLLKPRNFSVFQKANLLFTPNAYKVSKGYSILPTDGTGDLNFSRTTSGTRFNRNGNVITEITNMPRLDWFNNTPKWLLEFQSTNLLFPSNIGSSFSINTANTLARYVLSFFGNGTVTYSNAVSGSLTGVDNTTRVEVPITTTTTSTIDFAVSGDVFNWQFERIPTTLENRKASSLIPTTSSIITRTRDLFALTNSSLINQTEGSVFIDFFIKNRGTFLRIRSANSTNRINIFITDPTSVNFTYFVNNVQKASYSNSVNSSFNRAKLVMSYGQTFFKIFLNGSLVFETTFSTVSFSQTVEVIELGHTNEAGHGDLNYFGITELLTNEESINATL
jgi:hypothetical protein